MKKKRLRSLLLSAVLLFNAGAGLLREAVTPLAASAADGRLYNQWDEKWKEVTFTKYSKSGNSLYTSACGIFSFCNAMYGLNSRKIDVVELATWAVDIGALRPGAGGTYRDILYKHIEEKWGEAYGFTLGEQKLGTVRDEEFIEHLKSGGVAVLYVPGHFIAVTGYNDLYKTYHVIESAVSTNRGLEPDSWVTAEKLTSGGTNGTWYVLISNITAPEYAAVSLERTLWGVEEMMDCSLDSNTRNDYVLHFYQKGAEKPLYDLPVSDRGHSTTQHMICALTAAGEYEIDADGENEFGKVKSPRFGFRVYDQKVSSVSFELLTEHAETGKPVRFRTAGSPAAGYTLNMTDIKGASAYTHYVADMLDGVTLKSSEAEWIPEYPGEYTCTATLANHYGDVTTDAVKLTVYGDVTFTLDPSGGTLEDSAGQTAPYLGKYGSLPVPVRDNHRFDGWFTAAGEAGTQVTADTVMTETHPHKLYAHWTKVLETGDINGDHSVDPADAQLTLREYVTLMSGQAAAFDAAQVKAADIDRNGEVGIEDAQNILRYYVRNTVAGLNVTWEDLLAESAPVTTTAVTTTTASVTTTTAAATTVTTAATTRTAATTAKTTAATTRTAATTAKTTAATTKTAATTAKTTAATTKAAATTAKTTAATTKTAATTAKTTAATTRTAATTAKTTAATTKTAG